MAAEQKMTAGEQIAEWLWREAMLEPDETQFTDHYEQGGFAAYIQRRFIDAAVSEALEKQAEEMAELQQDVERHAEVIADLRRRRRDSGGSK